MANPLPQSATLQAAEIAASNTSGNHLQIPKAENVFTLARPNTGFEALAIDAIQPLWYWNGNITESNWNKSFPYQLVVVKKDGAKYVPLKTFTLPIPPQDLQISTPYAITVNQTLGGVIEEHNGAPVRQIAFSGTTGVLPLRGTANQLTSPKDFADNMQSIFAGTINSAKATAAAAISIVNGPQYDTNINTDVDLSKDERYRGTGYYQFRLLQLFLESYVNIKRTAAGKDLRLALCIWKDEAVYLVTPMAFDVRRSASSPFEYSYSMTFRAWARINPEFSASEAGTYRAGVYSPDKLKETFDRLLAARAAIQNAVDTVHAARTDVNAALFEPLRQVIMGVKELLGLSATVADLPAAIARDAKSIIDEAKDIPDTAKATKGAYTQYGDMFGSTKREIVKSNSLKTHGPRNPRPKSSDNRNDTSRAIASRNSDRQLPPVADPSNNDLALSKLKLTPAQKAKVEAERKRIRGLTKTDYQAMRAQVASFANEFACMVGASSPTFNNTYGVTGNAIKTTPSQQDLDALFAMEETLASLDKIILYKTDESNAIAPIEYVAGLARNSGLAFQVPTSKFAVPFPYGSTLEMLAARYLGDPQRWIEIAALNGLQSPYVDEEGFDVPLLVNGNGNQIVVAVNQNLYVGQPVWVSSNMVARTRRVVTSITTVGSNYVVKLSGEATLGSYLVREQAKLHAFLPNTVNSQMMVYIPSDKPAREDTYQIDRIPTTEESETLLSVAGIDLLLTEDLDLVINSSGDGHWSVGMNNLVQRLKIGLATPRGSLLQHLTYGLQIPVGSSVADSDPKEVLEGLRNFVAADSAFTGLQSASIVRQGPVTQIAAAVGVAGVSNYLPIAVNVR